MSVKQSIRISLCNRLDIEIMPQVKGNTEALISVPKTTCETLGIQPGDEVWATNLRTGACVAARAYVTDRFRFVGMSQRIREVLSLEIHHDAAPGKATCRDISVRISPFRFDISLSYSSQQRDVVSEVNACLADKHLRLLYDVDQQTQVLLGSNLTHKLPKTFAIESEWCAAFFSPQYFQSKWTQLELRSVMEEEKKSGREILIPVMLREVPLPAPLDLLCYLDARQLEPSVIAERIFERIE